MALSRVVFIPAKGTSDRVESKNLRKIDDKSLVEIAIEKVIRADCFDHIILDSDCPVIKDLCQKYCNSTNCYFSIMDRDPIFATNETNGNELMLNEFYHYPNYDLYFQFHCTSPLIKPETITKLVEEFTDKAYLQDGIITYKSSILTVKKMNEYFWDSFGRPEYDLDEMPNSQKMPVRFMETHALYGARKDIIRNLKRRTGTRPILFEVSEMESYDVNNEDDLAIVQRLAKFPIGDHM